ncbi:MAG: argininosuccinate lyase [Desulfomonile tiedjei]|uniref:Argininosuccinate lyase n=1 Tax=Desulfomonile tiedjei TaxID=2358 RepID=A0A9D6V243_9BACT|nr:argininosuccinate lyase [Desulfomonile tiedjei]
MAVRSRNKTKTGSDDAAGIRKGRFREGMDPVFARFNASISFDKRLFEQDIQGSIAHVKMLAAERIIPESDGLAIEQGLQEVLADYRRGEFTFREELEDVHINIEEALKAKIGDIAGKLHTARSRNDQVVLDLRLYAREKNEQVRADLAALMAAIVQKAEESIDLIVPGYTHLQRAQPVRLAHHLMAYFQMLMRDLDRFRGSLFRADEMPLGSAALAGTTFPINREYVAGILGFSRPTANSMDAVSDRDFVLEFLFNSSMVMMHLSRLAEELILWSSSEYGYCTLPDAYCSGSSIMPQKKNPDACELVRGKTGRVYGDLVALLTTAKALPLTYNKDLQEDKEPFFDAADTVLGSLKIMAGLVPSIEFNAKRMYEAASDPSLAATDLADRLTREGVPFREAHAKIGALVRAESTKKGKTPRDFPNPEAMVEARDHIGGTARERVMEQINAAKMFLTSLEGPPREPKTSRKRKG